MRPVRIGIAAENDRAAALALVRHEYMARGYVQALEPLNGNGVTLVARYGGRVIGTAAVAMKSAGLLPTEEYYGLNLPGKIAEVGRLAVAAPDEDTQLMAMVGLLGAIQNLSDTSGITTVLASLKPALRIRLRVLGVSSALAAGPERLVQEAIPQQYWGYFFPEGKQPQPVAVTIELDAVRAAVLGGVERANGAVRMAPEVLPHLSVAS